MIPCIQYFKRPTLSDVLIDTQPKDAKVFIQKVLSNRGTNYSKNQTTMTAFYCETIKRRRTPVSLSEAVSGFSDPDFWGAYNVIEPESAIEKNQKQLLQDKKDTKPTGREFL